MKKYKVERRSISDVVIEFYPKTAKYLSSAVIGGYGTGLFFSKIYNASLMPAEQIVLGATATFMMLGTGFLASMAIDNFKQERQRVQELIKQMQIEKEAKKQLKNQRNLNDYVSFSIPTREPEDGLVKRLVKTGYFKEQ